MYDVFIPIHCNWDLYNYWVSSVGEECSNPVPSGLVKSLSHLLVLFSSQFMELHNSHPAVTGIMTKSL